MMRRLSLSIALVACSVAPAFAGGGGEIDGTGKLILRAASYVGKLAGLF